jgi:hypothetical protein
MGIKHVKRKAIRSYEEIPAVPPTEGTGGSDTRQQHAASPRNPLRAAYMSISMSEFMSRFGMFGSCQEGLARIFQVQKQVQEILHNARRK